MRKPHIIVSGEAGHGKDSVGSYLVENHGYQRAAFGDPLKEEVFGAYLQSPQPVTWESVNGREVKELALERLALRYCSDASFISVCLQNFATEDRQVLPFLRAAIAELGDQRRERLTFLGKPAATAFNIEAFTETQRIALPRSFRRICQIWGTEHRRGPNGTPNYWIDMMDAFVDKSTRPVVITDGRFINECEWADKKRARRMNVWRPTEELAPQSDEARAAQLLANAKSALANWVANPSMEALFQCAHAEMAMVAKKQPKHSSEMIPPINEQTAHMVNDGTLQDLHDKVEGALQMFISESRQRLSL